MDTFGGTAALASIVVSDANNVKEKTAHGE
jgi:hypothetical protein